MAHLKTFAQGVKRFERFAEDMTASLQRLIEDIKAAPPGNLNEIIAQLQVIEERNSIRLQPFRDHLVSNRRTFVHDPDPKFRLMTLSLIDRYDRAMASALEILRDARWEIMAFRAHLEKLEGKIFDQQDDLFRYLEDLSK